MLAEIRPADDGAEFGVSERFFASFGERPDRPDQRALAAVMPPGENETAAFGGGFFATEAGVDRRGGRSRLPAKGRMDASASRGRG
jgi:hypothetical protein